MSTIVRTLLDIAIRTGGLLGFHLLVLLLMWLLARDSTGGANIGAGLLAFALIIVISGLWGFYDGRRRGFGRLALIWVPTAVLTAVGMSLLFQSSLHIDVDVFLSDLRDSGGFLILVVLLPAVLSGGLGALMRPGTSPQVS